MGSRDANADFLLSVVQAEVLCLRALSWDGRRFLGYDSITAFISQAAFTPQRVVPSQVFACICSHFFLVSTTQHQTSFSLVQFISVAQSCPTLCDPMNHSTSGLPVHHQLLEFAQTHIHRVSDAIQPSHPLSSPSPPAPNPSQHQSLFQ